MPSPTLPRVTHERARALAAFAMSRAMASRAAYADRWAREVLDHVTTLEERGNARAAAILRGLAERHRSGPRARAMTRHALECAAELTACIAFTVPKAQGARERRARSGSLQVTHLYLFGKLLRDFVRAHGEGFGAACHVLGGR